MAYKFATIIVTTRVGIRLSLIGTLSSRLVLSLLGKVLFPALNKVVDSNRWEAASTFWHWWISIAIFNNIQ